jgi:hypothetical protein
MQHTLKYAMCWNFKPLVEFVKSNTTLFISYFSWKNINKKGSAREET